MVDRDFKSDSHMQAGYNPVGSEDPVAETVMPEMPEEVQEMLRSLSNKQIGDFVRLRDEVIDKIRTENPLISEEDLQAKLHEKVAPVIRKWLDETD